MASRHGWDDPATRGRTKAAHARGIALSRRRLRRLLRQNETADAQAQAAQAMQRNGMERSEIARRLSLSQVVTNNRIRRRLVRGHSDRTRELRAELKRLEQSVLDKVKPQARGKVKTSRRGERDTRAQGP